MARPPLALGHHGTIKTTRENGTWVALCRYRDLDGTTRKVTRRGHSKTAAQKALQEALRDRRGERSELLEANSRFSDAAEIWMVKVHQRREDSTEDIYRY